MESSTTSPETPAQKTVKYLDRLARLNLWTGILGLQHLKWNQGQHRKNREAEESHARKVAWGWKGGDQGQAEEDEDMGHTILGDVTNPTPLVVQPKQASQWPLALGMAAATLFPTAGALYAYMMSRQPTTEVNKPSFDDASVKIGLGRIEDYQTERKP